MVLCCTSDTCCTHQIDLAGLHLSPSVSACNPAKGFLDRVNMITVCMHASQLPCCATGSMHAIQDCCIVLAMLQSCPYILRVADNNAGSAWLGCSAHQSLHDLR